MSQDRHEYEIIFNMTKTNEIILQRITWLKTELEKKGAISQKNVSANLCDNRLLEDNAQQVCQEGQPFLANLH